MAQLPLVRPGLPPLVEGEDLLILTSTRGWRMTGWSRRNRRFYDKVYGEPFYQDQVVGWLPVDGS